MASKSQSKGGGIWELLKTIFYALLLAGLIRTLLFQPFWIPSSSMKPTLLIGDFLFVNKYAYGYSWNSCPAFGTFNLCSALEDREGRLFGSDPKRGDVVVFRQPQRGIDFIKRIVGMPGDRIQMLNGQVFINGTPVPREQTDNFVETFERQGPENRTPLCKNRTVGLGAECLKDQFLETLPNGVAHLTLSVTNARQDNTQEYVVPEGHYFFLGDNRDNSTDSRFLPVSGGLGFVPIEDFVGRADRIIFSSGGSSLFFVWTWRADRLFKAVN